MFLLKVEKVKIYRLHLSPVSSYRKYWSHQAWRQLSKRAWHRAELAGQSTGLASWPIQLTESLFEVIIQQLQVKVSLLLQIIIKSLISDATLHPSQICMEQEPYTWEEISPGWYKKINWNRKWQSSMAKGFYQFYNEKETEITIGIIYTSFYGLLHIDILVLTAYGSSFKQWILATWIAVLLCSWHLALRKHSHST